MIDAVFTITTLAFFAMRFLPPRPRFRRLGRQPGFVACSAATLAIAFHVVGLVTVGSADRVSDSHGPTARELQTALAASVRVTPSRGAKNVATQAVENAGRLCRGGRLVTDACLRCP